MEATEAKGLYEDPTLFGKFMFRLRNEYGWSRAYVAERLKFNSESSVMNFETGHTVMKPKHVSRFCAITPTKLTLPVLFAMFEAGSIKPPCKCVCHLDRNNSIPSIYNDEGDCRLCDHGESDCMIVNGLWFEQKKDNYFKHEVEE